MNYFVFHIENIFHQSFVFCARKLQKPRIHNYIFATRAFYITLSSTTQFFGFWFLEPCQSQVLVKVKVPNSFDE